MSNIWQGVKEGAKEALGLSTAFPTRRHLLYAYASYDSPVCFSLIMQNGEGYRNNGRLPRPTFDQKAYGLRGLATLEPLRARVCPLVVLDAVEYLRQQYQPLPHAVTEMLRSSIDYRTNERLGARAPYSRFEVCDRRLMLEPPTEDSVKQWLGYTENGPLPTARPSQPPTGEQVDRYRRADELVSVLAVLWEFGWERMRWLLDSAGLIVVMDEVSRRTGLPHSRAARVQREDDPIEDVCARFVDSLRQYFPGPQVDLQFRLFCWLALRTRLIRAAGGSLEGGVHELPKFEPDGTTVQELTPSTQDLTELARLLGQMASDGEKDAWLQTAEEEFRTALRPVLTVVADGRPLALEGSLSGVSWTEAFMRRAVASVVGRLFDAVQGVRDWLNPEPTAAQLRGASVRAPRWSVPTDDPPPGWKGDYSEPL